MIKSTHEQIRATIRWYIKHKIPFTYTYQNDTISIESKMGSYTTRGIDYTISELNFIRKVKKTILDNGLHYLFANRFKTEASRKKIKYYQYNKQLRPGFEVSNCVLIDLNNAYWETAYQLLLLPPDIYKFGLTLRKQARLAALGSLAKKQRIFEFDGKNQKTLPIKRSEETEFLWAVICNHISKLLCNVAEATKDDYLFFWVDGIYSKPAASKKIQKMFSQANYKSKIISVEKVRVTDRNIWVTCKEKSREKIIEDKEIMQDTFPFPFRKQEIQREMAGYNVDL